MSRLPLAACITGALLLTGGSALADFADDSFHAEEYSAYTLRAEEVKIGPTAVRYGIVGELQIGTEFALNLLGALNADLKWTLYRHGRLGIGLEAGFAHFDPRLVGIDEAFSVTAVPLRAHISVEAHRALRVHLRLTYLAGDPDAEAPDLVKRIQRYLGPVGQLEGKLAVEWRMTDHLALIADVAVPIVSHDAAFRYESEASDDVGAMTRTTLSLFGTYDTFNFRVGIGFGPSFLGEASVFPVADLYWRVF